MAARPTRSQIIGTIVSDAVLQSRMTWNAYADAVVQHYHATTDVADRLVEFRVATTADNADQATRNNTQTVKRMLIGEIRMHVDIEESLIGALPEAWRERLLTALLERQGLIYAKAPRPAEPTSSKLAPGEMMTVEWRGQPVWILRRTEAMLATLEEVEPQLADPTSEKSVQPPYAKNRHRSIKPEYLVVIGICTHLGCSPTAKFAKGEASGIGKDWLGGYLCPCHGSRFDLAARVFKSQPAPTNLTVPPHQYLTDTKILIGEDKA